MTPTQHTTSAAEPEALRLANEFKLCNEYDSIPSITDIAKAEAELRRQHARIAELEAELEAVGAGGVQALAASAPVAPIQPMPYPTDGQIDAVYQQTMGQSLREQDAAAVRRFGRAMFLCAWNSATEAAPVSPAPQPADERQRQTIECMDSWAAAVGLPTYSALAAAPKAGPQPEPASIHLQDLKNALADVAELRQQLRLLEDYAGNSVWRWQADGADHLESMGARMSVLIYASDLRALLTAPPAPSAQDAEDAALLDYLQDYGATVEIIPRTDGWNFRVGGQRDSERTSIRAAIAAARAQQKGGA